MSINDFSFVTQKNDNIKSRQAILSLESEKDIEKLSRILKVAKIHILGKTTEASVALELVRKHKSGLFFLDYDLQALGSMTVLDKIRANTPNVKIIVLANKLDKEQVSDAKKRGVAGFLAKPLTNDAISKLLSKLL